MCIIIKCTITTHNKFRINLNNQIIQDKRENGQTLGEKPHVPQWSRQVVATCLRRRGAADVLKRASLKRK